MTQPVATLNNQKGETLRYVYMRVVYGVEINRLFYNISDDKNGSNTNQSLCFIL